MAENREMACKGVTVFGGQMVSVIIKIVILLCQSDLDSSYFTGVTHVWHSP